MREQILCVLRGNCYVFQGEFHRSGATVPLIFINFPTNVFWLSKMERVLRLLQFPRNHSLLILCTVLSMFSGYRGWIFGCMQRFMYTMFFFTVLIWIYICVYMSKFRIGVKFCTSFYLLCSPPFYLFAHLFWCVDVYKSLLRVLFLL